MAFCGVPVKPGAGSRISNERRQQVELAVFVIVTSNETVPVSRSDRVVVKVSETYGDRSLTAVKCVTYGASRPSRLAL